MRILIISDLHGNLEAVESLPKDFDQLWVLGDLVNYGPNPAEVVAFVRQHASIVVRGNHDHSIAFGEDARCSSRFRQMAKETGEFTRSRLSEEDVRYLVDLPLETTVELDGKRFRLCHATPADPLYEYRLKDSTRWLSEEGPVPDVLLVGHTHLPFQRYIDGHLVANPGSVGQPKHGRPEACYAIWEDGRLALASASYPFEETIRKIRNLPVSVEVREDLAFVLRNGMPP